jgi:hypothetical protein
MRINVYTEEMKPEDQPEFEIVTADYVSSRTGLTMTNYGLRVFLKSAPELHYIPGRDDDRSAITFWCGDSMQKVLAFADRLFEAAAKVREAEQEKFRTAKPGWRGELSAVEQGDMIAG